MPTRARCSAPASQCFSTLPLLAGIDASATVCTDRQKAFLFVEKLSADMN